MLTHFANDEDVMNELSAGIRSHGDGLFEFGMDVAVVNVTQDAFWYRKAILPDLSGAVPPMREMVQAAARTGKQLPKQFVFREPRRTRDEQQVALMRELEIDPNKYYPPGMFREQITTWLKGYKIDLEKMLGKKPDAK